ncbi:SVM family protein [Candidatus Phytoplasma australiense]|uniref:Sequence-variable mosaic (SVM) signal sequence domain-containing protein n=1 Tax=Strawberry lethal yellows phytoplasma (CPA) str. NZSb11 TaxID=980422 RepID=R4RW49_PHYAS|nr:SVM family protein [Candidatus Phytoplasma australiense]AGL90072.1 hypothetical protein SLY_0148 [Strawberry lethal yellows phytoplasma (CPA) str. NZSb11]
MFKLQNQLKIISICLLAVLGMLLIINNNQVMAMESNNKNQQKKEYEEFDEAIDNLKEGIKYFNKKRIQINLNKITKLLSRNEKRNSPTESSSTNSKKIKK